MLTNLITWQAIQTARMELELSQKDVAQKINEKPSILQDYESSKAIPNPQILAKLERVLKVKLRGKLHQFLVVFYLYLTRNFLLGADIGKKLEGPKKA